MHARPWALRLTVAAGVVPLVAAFCAVVPDSSASAAPTRPPALSRAAPMSHPQDDHAGSTIAAHEGPGSPAGGISPAAAQTLGMDVSHWQGTINWSSAYAKGGRFAYIKATESTTYIDPTFSQNTRGSVYAGLLHGAYHFALPNLSSGAAQAAFFVAHGGGASSDGKTMPPMLDMEYNPYGASCYGMSQAAMVSWIHAFSNGVNSRTGRYPTIYTTTNWWTSCTGNNSSFGSTNPLFIARWASSVGTLPAGWSSYTLWQYDNAGTFPGDQDRFNGDSGHLQAFGRGCSAGPPSTAQILPSTGMSYDFTADGHPDLLTRSADGLLHLYYGNGGRIVGTTVIGCGWNGFTSIFSPGDFNGDGHPDIMGRTATGDLWIYYWNGQRIFASAKIGNGWNASTALFSPGDFTGDGHPDIIGRASDGKLRLYNGNGWRIIASHVIGTGWNTMTGLFSTGDFTGDRQADIFARSADGVLRLYPGKGNGVTAPRVIGVGWNTITGFDGSVDWTGDHHSDLLARRSDGYLILYRGNGARFVSTAVIGNGWTAMTAIS